MKLVAKTMKKVVIELTTNEIEEVGFECLWDRIRGTYKAEHYDVYSIAASKENDKIIFIELIKKVDLD